MKIEVEVNGEMLTKGLTFHGETYGDAEVIKKLNNLQQILEDVISEIINLNYRVEYRQEGSAIDIKNKIATMGKELGIKFYYED